MVEAAKVFLSLYIILELMGKNFVNAMDHQGEGFKCMGELFFYKTETKIKQDVFVGPEITKLMKDKDFKTKLNSSELDA